MVSNIVKIIVTFICATIFIIIIGVVVIVVVTNDDGDENVDKGTVEARDSKSRNSGFFRDSG